MSETEVRQTESRLELMRSINAPPGAVFALITDPAGHVKIDGSGMLVAAQSSSPMTGVGDSFVMNMDREALGDIPLGTSHRSVTSTAIGSSLAARVRRSSRITSTGPACARAASATAFLLCRRTCSRSHWTTSIAS
jgi:hypothetical protein